MYHFVLGLVVFFGLMVSIAWVTVTWLLEIWELGQCLLRLVIWIVLIFREFLDHCALVVEYVHLLLLSKVIRCLFF